jgi:hypothetical protein
MNTVLAWLVIGMALVGLASGVALIATVMRDLFDHRHHHA